MVKHHIKRSSEAIRNCVMNSNTANRVLSTIFSGNSLKFQPIRSKKAIFFLL